MVEGSCYVVTFWEVEARLGQSVRVCVTFLFVQMGVHTVYLCLSLCMPDCLPVCLPVGL